MANELFKINLGHLIGFIKTKTQKQYYSKKQKLQNKLKILEENFVKFFKIDIQKCDKKIKNILDDIRSKLTNPNFLKSYSELNYDLQIKELLSNKNQTFVYNDKLNSEIFFTNIQYFTQFYKSSHFNLDFLNLSNHYLNLYDKDEIKNVKIKCISNLYENDESHISVKNSKNSFKNTFNMHFSSLMDAKNISNDSNKFLRSKRPLFHSSKFKNYYLESKSQIKESNAIENKYSQNFINNFMQSIYSPNKALSEISFLGSKDKLSSNSKNQINKCNFLENNIHSSKFIEDYMQSIYNPNKALRSKVSFLNSVDMQNIFDCSNKFLRSKRSLFSSSKVKNYSLKSKKQTNKSNMIENIEDNMHSQKLIKDFTENRYNDPNKALRNKILLSNSTINSKNGFLKSKNSLKNNSLGNTDGNIYFSNFFGSLNSKNKAFKQ